MKIFKTEVRSAFSEWGRYAVYMTAVCFDPDGEVIDYVNLDDRAASGNNALTLETPPCDHADLYLYVIAREFPASDVISASPPFNIEVVVNGASKNCSVNQWGGISVKQRLTHKS